MIDDKSFDFRAYHVTMTKIMDETNIRMEKITPGAIAKAFETLKEKIGDYNRLIQNVEMEMKLNAVNERFRVHQELKKRFRENKRLIKEKLHELGIEVKPGSDLSKLLRLDYLPYPTDKVSSKRF